MKKKIFVSSSGINIKDVELNITYLAENGIKKIELSGGCSYNKNIIYKLKKLRKKYNLEYMVHNYFPPPRNNFVLNIGSCNNLHYRNTIQFYKKTIDLCRSLGVKNYGIHSGFLIDIKSSELGNKIKKRKLYPRNQSIERLAQGYKALTKYSKNKVALYLENNVITKNNLEEYKENPLLFTSFSDYLNLKKRFNFKILLDIAHLKVSAKTLGNDFIKEVKKFKKYVNYVHISGNNSLQDQNNSIHNDKKIKEAIKNLVNADIFTLEVYENIKLILKSKKICEKFLVKSKSM